MRARSTRFLLPLMLIAAPAGAMTQNSRTIADHRTAVADPDAVLERMAAASRQQAGSGENRLPRRTIDVLRNDRYLREAFAGVGHR